MAGRILRRRTAGVALALAVPAFALAGCSKVIDNGKLQDKIKSDLEARGATNVSANCPGSVPAKAGHTFTCTATYTSGGATHNVTITVNQTDNNGDVVFQITGSSSGASSSSNSGSSGNS